MMAPAMGNKDDTGLDIFSRYEGQLDLSKPVFNLYPLSLFQTQPLSIKGIDLCHITLSVFHH